MDDSLLNIAAIRRRTRTNGPGWRAAVWVQGCTIRCPGCFNPETHAHEARHFWVPETLAEWMTAADVEGVTLLGGEPFEQAAACGRLARRARELGGSVVTYSGYTWDYLRHSTIPEVKTLIDATDLLIAGPFVSRLRTDGCGWHGSSNQEFIFLTDRYDDRIRCGLESEPIIELWTDGRTAEWSGIPVKPPLEEVT